jgi:hypothetical protein
MPQGGQIVAHLISGSGLSQGLMFLGLGILPAAASAIAGIVPIVLNGMTLANTYKILKATEGLMTLAELNLAVTSASFASLERRLNQLETKIDELRAKGDSWFYYKIGARKPTPFKGGMKRVAGV